MSLAACPSCARHVRRTENACPFCAATLDLPPAPPTRAIPSVGRAVMLAVGATITTTAGACETRSVPIYGAPDAAIDDGGVTDTGFDAGGPDAPGYDVPPAEDAAASDAGSDAGTPDDAGFINADTGGGATPLYRSPWWVASRSDCGRSRSTAKWRPCKARSRQRRAHYSAARDAHVSVRVDRDVELCRIGPTDVVHPGVRDARPHVRLTFADGPTDDHASQVVLSGGHRRGLQWDGEPGGDGDEREEGSHEADALPPPRRRAWAALVSIVGPPVKLLLAGATGGEQALHPVPCRRAEIEDFALAIPAAAETASPSMPSQPASAGRGSRRQDGEATQLGVVRHGALAAGIVAGVDLEVVRRAWIRRAVAAESSEVDEPAGLLGAR